MPTADPHDLCLLCLGEGHRTDKCGHCLAFSKQARKNRENRLRKRLWDQALLQSDLLVAKPATTSAPPDCHLSSADPPQRPAPSSAAPPSHPSGEGASAMGEQPVSPPKKQREKRKHSGPEKPPVHKKAKRDKAEKPPKKPKKPKHSKHRPSAMTQPWDLPAQPQPTSRRYEVMYNVREGDIPFLLHHPKPNLVVCLDNIIATLPDNQGDLVRVFLKEAMQVAVQQLSTARYHVDMDKRALVCAISLRRHPWLCNYNFPEEMKRIEEMPFDGSGLFNAKTDHKLKKIHESRMMAWRKYYRRLEKDVQEIVADTLLPHENYSAITSDNDIALLHLAHPVSIDRFKLPICLPSKNLATQELMKEGTKTVVTGWGKRSEEKYNFSSVLQYIEIPLVPRNDCINAMWNAISDNMLCAGIQGDSRDACDGDSGGPMVTKFKSTWFLIGLVSWGEGCGKLDNYGIYTKVSSYLDWIEEKMKQEENAQNLNRNPKHFIVMEKTAAGKNCVSALQFKAPAPPLYGSLSSEKTSIRLPFRNQKYGLVELLPPDASLKELFSFTNLLCFFFFRGTAEALPRFVPRLSKLPECLSQRQSSFFWSVADAEATASATQQNGSEPSAGTVPTANLEAFSRVTLGTYLSQLAHPHPTPPAVEPGFFVNICDSLIINTCIPRAFFSVHPNSSLSFLISLQQLLDIPNT
ncbi:Vitamin K-dependent protein C [Varanus komodoensis]|nr:Vitamin K-dependent protein C [Varanus komodoensis]